MDKQEEKPRQQVGGRPNLAEEEALIYRLVTRVKASEYTQVQHEFNQWKIGRVGRLADYLRDLILYHRGQRLPVGEGVSTLEIIEFTQALYDIRQQLKRIDTNYNQVAKRINSMDHTTGKLYYEVLASKGILDELALLVRQIDAVIRAQTETVFDA